MSNYRGIHHVSVLAADTERSLVFYREVLGMGVERARPDLGYPGAWIQAGSQQIHLLELADLAGNSGAPRPVHAGRDRHIALIVSDLDDLRQRLETAQISFTLSKSGRRALFCRDPDGNGLEFVEAVE